MRPPLIEISVAVEVPVVLPVGDMTVAPALPAIARHNAMAMPTMDARAAAVGMLLLGSEEAPAFPRRTTSRPPGGGTRCAFPFSRECATATRGIPTMS
jgi:hypothetical protein